MPGAHALTGLTARRRETGQFLIRKRLYPLGSLFSIPFERDQSKCIPMHISIRCELPSPTVEVVCAQESGDCFLECISLSSLFSVFLDFFSAWQHAVWQHCVAFCHYCIPCAAFSKKNVVSDFYAEIQFQNLALIYWKTSVARYLVFNLYKYF